MSDFARWSRWFECGLEIKRHNANAMALMAWMAAHASSDGSEIELNPEMWASLKDEIGGPDVVLDPERIFPAPETTLPLRSAIANPSLDRLTKR